MVMSLAQFLTLALWPSAPAGEGEGYVYRIDTVPVFEKLSLADSKLPGVDRSGKALVPVRDGDAGLLPVLFQNVNLYKFHLEFLLGEFPDKFAGLSNDEYLALIEKRATRQYYAEIIFRFPGTPATYGFDIFTAGGDPTELPRPDEVLWVHQHLTPSFTLGSLAYAPRDPLAIKNAQGWTNPGFPINFAFGGGLPDYIAYTRAENYGRVQVLTGQEFSERNDAGGFSFQDLVVLPEAPTDIEGVIAGVITGSIQGELGHLAIRTARRGTPNAYVKDAAAAFAPYDGKIVRLKVESTGYEVAEATAEEAQAWWDGHRPKLGDIPQVDADYSSLDFVGDIPTDGSVRLLTRYGGKASNFAKLYQLLPPENRVPAFVVPFHYYVDFLQTNKIRSRVNPNLLVTYAQYIAELLAEPTFRSDSKKRFDELEKLRNLIEDDGRVDVAAVSAIARRIVEVFGTGDVRVRCRSSSNVEDLLEFNGAGLYSSTSACAADDLDSDSSGPSKCDPTESKERGVARGLKKVWASLWNFRAFEEREYYQIPHLDSRMAVLMSEGFPDEAANGVAFTGNPDVVGDRRFLINVQLGDTPVVFPEPGVVPEKDVLELQAGAVTKVNRVRRSTLLAGEPPDKYVLTEDQLKTLGGLMASVEKRLTVEQRGEHKPEEIVLDFEFKLDQAGEIRFKQVRPFLISSTTPAGPTYHLTVPEGLTACGSFVERRALAEVMRHKYTVGFKAGTYDLRSDGTSSAEIFDWIEFGPDGPRLAPLGPGIWDAVPQTLTTGRVYAFTAEQVFDRGGEPVRISLENLVLPVAGPTEVTLDALAITWAISPLHVIGEVNFGNPVDIVQHTPYLPCDLGFLPQYTADVQFADGSLAHFEERFQDLEEGTGPAELVHAEVNLGGEARIVNDYWHLAYSAGHHNDTPRPDYWAIFEPPIDYAGVGRVKALYLSQGYRLPLPGDPPKAALLGESFEKLADLEITGFVRKKEGQNPLEFRRGDVDFSGTVNITDAILILLHLFQGGSPPICEDASDIDDLGSVDITDPIILLEFLFQGLDPPAPPGPYECGEDVEFDELPDCSGPGCR